MRMTVKGQVTIPIEMREKLGLLPNSEVEFALVGDSVRIRRPRAGRAAGSVCSSRCERRAPKSGMTTDELMAMTRGED